MAHLQVNIPDNQLQFFKNLINQLGYAYAPVKEADWYDELTAEQKEDIQAGLDDLDNGRVVSDEEVRAGIREKIQNAKKL